MAPTTQLTIYGIEVDSIAMECRLPHDKIVKIQEKLEGFCKRKKVQLKELQSLIGLLNFACSVIVPSCVDLLTSLVVSQNLSIGYV